MKILVTGGAGYLGSSLAHLLIAAGHEVCVLDNLMHGGRSLLGLVGRPGFTFLAGDIRDAGAVALAVKDADAVVHLAAIVGDPACARDPGLARAVNEHAAISVIDAARQAGARRFVFASTCSNYGRMRDTSIAATESHELRPVSLYAETKVAIEERLLREPPGGMATTVLRFATLFGPSPRMRFDLTVNQFVKEMLVDGEITVFGEQFWRPYVHVREAARAIGMVLDAPADVVRGQVFNVGHSSENYRKQDLLEIIQRHAPDAVVRFVAVADDPRDYRVSFERIYTSLGFDPAIKVPAGVDELAALVRAGLFGRYDDPSLTNTPTAPASPEVQACAR